MRMSGSLRRSRDRQFSIDDLEVTIMMKRTVLSVLAISAGVFTQSAMAQDAEKPLMAAPANLRAAASVIKWKSDFTYDTVKTGTSDIVCYDKSGMPGTQPFMLECTAKGNLPRAAQNLKFEALGDKAKTQAALDAAEKDGTRVKPVFGSVWYHLMGPDADHARAHMTIAVPGATTASLGLPDNGKAGGVWIMNAGTSTAHLMTPGE
jgi:hypothetical protein